MYHHNNSSTFSKQTSRHLIPLSPLQNLVSLVVFCCTKFSKNSPAISYLTSTLSASLLLNLLKILCFSTFLWVYVKELWVILRATWIKKRFALKSTTFWVGSMTWSYFKFSRWFLLYNIAKISEMYWGDFLTFKKYVLVQYFNKKYASTKWVLRILFHPSWQSQVYLRIK